MQYPRVRPRKLKKEVKDHHELKTAILTTKIGHRVIKIGHGYFFFHKVKNSIISQQVRNTLQSYPSWWFYKNKLQLPQYYEIFKFMIESNIKRLYIFQYQEEPVPYFILFQGIIHVNFPNLIDIQVSSENLVNLESLSFLQAPNLEVITISSNLVFSSISPFAKCNFPYLRNIKINVRIEKLAMSKHYDLSKISRIRMKNIHREDLYHYKHKKCQINFFRPDICDLSYLSKIQATYLKNFSLNENGRKLDSKSLNSTILIKGLKRKFRNKNIQSQWRHDENRYCETIYHFEKEDYYLQSDSDFQDEDEDENNIYDRR